MPWHGMARHATARHGTPRHATARRGWDITQVAWRNMTLHDSTWRSATLHDISSIGAHRSSRGQNKSKTGPAEERAGSGRHPRAPRRACLAHAGAGCELEGASAIMSQGRALSLRMDATAALTQSPCSPLIPHHPRYQPVIH